MEGRFNEAVRPLLVDLPIEFSREGKDILQEKSYIVDCRTAYERYAKTSDLHVVQSYFALSGAEPPKLPYTLKLRSSFTSIRPSVVIAPFSAHDRAPDHLRFHDRAWYDARWHEVIDAIFCLKPPRSVCVLGSGDDDFQPFQRQGVEVVIDRPLTEVVTIIRDSSLFISIDTGLSHVAHLIGKKEHLLLYPDYFSRNWACNPRGRLIQGRPVDISVKDVIGHTVRFLMPSVSDQLS